MRVESRFMYIKKDGKRLLYDEAGQPVNLNELIKQFNPEPDAPVFVKLIADDGRHEEIPFTIATVRAILGARRKGYFGMQDGRKVNIFNASAAGKYPIIGLDPNGFPVKWDANGIPEDGNKEYRLHIFELITSEQPAPEEEDAPAEESQEAEGAKQPEPEAPADSGSPLDEI